MQTLEAAIRDVSQQILEGLLGGAPPSGELDPRAPKTWPACAIRIHGEWEGRIFVRASPALALWAAERMFGDNVDGECDIERAKDALREITNIIGGHLKAMLGTSNHLGLPEDLPEDIATPPDSAIVAEVIMRHAGEVLEVRMFRGA